MCVGLRNPCTNSDMHPWHGIPGLKDTCRVWDLPRVRWILTCTSYFVRDLAPHVGRIIYFSVIKVNINKA